MNLKENDQIPNSEIFIFENNAPVKKNLHDLLKGKKAVIFGLPGAYTSVCSANIYQDTLIILINTKKKV